MIKEKNILSILISSTILVIAWIAFNIYHTSVTSTLNTELTMQIVPIPSEFNPKAIDAILKRDQVEPTYELAGGGTIRQASGAAQSQPEPEPEIEVAEEEASSSPSLEGAPVTQ